MVVARRPGPADSWRDMKSLRLPGGFRQPSALALDYEAACFGVMLSPFVFIVGLISDSAVEGYCRMVPLTENRMRQGVAN